MDLKGQYVFPGLQDAHIHVWLLGESAFQVELSRCASIAEIQAAVRTFAEANPTLPWIVGRGWHQEALQERRYRIHPWRSM